MYYNRSYFSLWKIFEYHNLIKYRFKSAVNFFFFVFRFFGMLDSHECPFSLGKPLEHASFKAMNPGHLPSAKQSLGGSFVRLCSQWSGSGRHHRLSWNAFEETVSIAFQSHCRQDNYGETRNSDEVCVTNNGGNSNAWNFVYCGTRNWRNTL